ncbi:hypothetical protein AAC387_Pa02g2658 [Persea americana]
MEHELEPVLYMRRVCITYASTGPDSYVGSSTDKWLPPPGWTKFNFDGAFNYHTDAAGIGGIVRDCQGKLLSSYAGKVVASHPLEAELRALQKGLEVCKGLEISFLQIDGDSLLLVAALQQEANLAWDLVPLWRNIMELLMV